MRGAMIVLIGCALLSFVSPDGVLADGAMRINELNEIVKAIEIEAETWASSTPVGVPVVHQLRSVWYDKGSIEPLKTVMEPVRKSPNDLFVVNRILSPMLNAKPEVIAEALGMIHPITERMAVYEPLPTYTEKQLEAMAPPEDASKSVRDLARKKRNEKREAELAVMKHNQQVRAMRAIVYRLMVLARNRDQDAVLLKALVVSEKNGDWMYADILEAVRSQVRKMSEERGKVFYTALRTFWRDLRAIEGSGKRDYVDQGSVEIVTESNSRFTTHSDIAKTRTLNVINLVATAARMPALKDPKTKKKPQEKTPSKNTKGRRKR